jgi:hypothetical protein
MSRVFSIIILALSTALILVSETAGATIAKAWNDSTFWKDGLCFHKVNSQEGVVDLDTLKAFLMDGTTYYCGNKARSYTEVETTYRTRDLKVAVDLNQAVKFSLTKVYLGGTFFPNGVETHELRTLYTTVSNSVNTLTIFDYRSSYISCRTIGRSDEDSNQRGETSSNRHAAILNNPDVRSVIETGNAQAVTLEKAIFDNDTKSTGRYSVLSICFETAKFKLF